MRRALVGILRGEARFLRVFESNAPHKTKLQQIDAIRDQIAKTIAGLRSLNDTVVYEFGVDRERHIRLSDSILRAALSAVPFFWNQLSILHSEQDADFITEPGLVDMRRNVAAHIDAMAEALAKAAPPPQATGLVDPALLNSSRYGEYARNTIAAHDELARTLAAI
jgi:multidrug resistance protein MdtO